MYAIRSYYGKEYSGTANVVGKEFITKYVPLKDSNGNIIGMLFVGTPKAPFATLVDGARNDTIIIAIIGVITSYSIHYTKLYDLKACPGASTSLRIKPYSLRTPRVPTRSIWTKSR